MWCLCLLIVNAIILKVIQCDMHRGNSQAGLPENMLHHSRHPSHQVVFILSSSSLFWVCVYFQCDLTMSLSSLWFSKCGSYPPESCLFSLIGNVGAFMGKVACSHISTYSTPAVTYQITENKVWMEAFSTLAFNAFWVTVAEVLQRQIGLPAWEDMISMLHHH